MHFCPSSRFPEEVDIFEERPIGESSTFLEKSGTHNDALISKFCEQGIESCELRVRIQNPMGPVKTQSKRTDLHLTVFKVLIQDLKSISRKKGVSMEEEQNISRRLCGTSIALRAPTGTRTENDNSL